MLPERFLESSCLKCHHQVTDVPQAKKLQAGYERIVKYGCTGCHTIGGEGSFGPDLTDERQVGPNLAPRRLEGLQGLDAQVDQEPARVPARHAGCRGSTASPTTTRPKDRPKNDAEIHAITHYLFAKSTPPADFVDPPAKSDPASGARTSSSRRAAWPATRTGPTSRRASSSPTASSINPDYKPDPAATFDPSGFPESVRDYAKADFGPNLVEHRRQVPVARAGLQVAGQLDQGARGVSPQEPDAQPPALARRTPPTSPPGSSRSRASGR